MMTVVENLPAATSLNLVPPPSDAPPPIPSRSSTYNVQPPPPPSDAPPPIPSRSTTFNSQLPPTSFYTPTSQPPPPSSGLSFTEMIKQKQQSGLVKVERPETLPSLPDDTGGLAVVLATAIKERRIAIKEDESDFDDSSDDEWSE